MIEKNTICLWFEKDAEAAARFYAATFPNSSSTFTAFDTCDKCSFAGQNGSVSLRAYGTTTKKGFTSGTFLITSNGTILPTATSRTPAPRAKVEPRRTPGAAPSDPASRVRTARCRGDRNRPTTGRRP